jgi:hypothetical protein
MWYERRPEEPEMTVQLASQGTLRRKSHGCGTSLPKKQFPASILVALARHHSMLTSRLVQLQLPALLRAKMLHGGALEYGSSKQPTTTLAALAWHPLRVYKQVSSTLTFAPNAL